MSNYSTLQQNTLDGLSETAGELYLKLLDVFQGHRADGERRAFLAACHYDERVGNTLDYILRNSPISSDLTPATITKLGQFFAERWRHNFMPARKAGDA